VYPREPGDESACSTNGLELELVGGFDSSDACGPLCLLDSGTVLGVPLQVTKRSLLMVPRRLRINVDEGIQTRLRTCRLFLKSGNHARAARPLLCSPQLSKHKVCRDEM
jgi:hypothetical protein